MSIESSDPPNPTSHSNSNLSKAGGTWIIFDNTEACKASIQNLETVDKNFPAEEAIAQLALGDKICFHPQISDTFIALRYENKEDIIHICGQQGKKTPSGHEKRVSLIQLRDQGKKDVDEAWLLYSLNRLAIMAPKKETEVDRLCMACRTDPEGLVRALFASLRADGSHIYRGPNDVPATEESKD
jgi:hypothetical protein